MMPNIVDLPQRDTTAAADWSDWTAGGEPILLPSSKRYTPRLASCWQLNAKSLSTKQTSLNSRSPSSLVQLIFYVARHRPRPPSFQQLKLGAKTPSITKATSSHSLAAVIKRSATPRAHPTLAMIGSVSSPLVQGSPCAVLMTALKNTSVSIS